MIFCYRAEQRLFDGGFGFFAFYRVLHDPAEFIVVLLLAFMRRKMVFHSREIVSIVGIQRYGTLTRSVSAQSSLRGP